VEGRAGAVPSLAVVRLGGGRQGLAWWRRRAALGVSSRIGGGGKRLVVVLMVAEWRRPLPTPTLRSDKGPQRAGGLLGAVQQILAVGMPTTSSSSGAAMSLA
jgi:hypothetical protein